MNAIMPGTPSHRPAKPAVRRRLLWVGLIAGAVAVCGYATLPWLLPPEWLARHFAARLSDTLDRPVTIQRVRFGYQHGLTLENVEIMRRRGFGDEPFFRADRVQARLASQAWLRPLKLLGGLFGHWQLADSVTLQQPRCWIVINHEGVLNIADLADEPAGAWLGETSDLRQLEVTVIDLRSTAEPDRPQYLALPLLDCRIDRRNGQLTWTGTKQWQDARGVGGRLTTAGSLTTPRLRPDQPLGGEGTLEWQGLPLEQIPRVLLPAEHVSALQGRSHGTIRMRVNADFEIDFTLRLELADAELQLAGEHNWSLFEDTRLEAAGSWDPHHPRLEVSSLRFEVPQVLTMQQVPGRPAVRLDPQAEDAVSIAVQGRTNSLEQVHRHISGGLADGALAELDSSGPCDFTLEFAKNLEQERYTLTADARGARLRLPEIVNLPADIDKQFSLEMTRRESGWRIRRLGLMIEDASVDLHGDWPATTELPPDWTRGARGTLDFKTSNLPELFERIPALRGALDLQAEAGPIALQQHLQPHEDGVLLKGVLSVDAGTGLRLGPHLVKAVGQPLELGYQVRCPTNRPGHFEDVELDLRYGRGLLRTIGDDNRAQFTSGSPGVARGAEAAGTLEATVIGHVEVDEVGALLELFPEAHHSLDQPEWGAIVAEGGCSARLALNGGVIEGHPVFRGRFEIDARSMNLALGDVFVKPRGRRCTLDLDYRYDQRSQTEPQMAGVVARLPGGSCDLRYEWIPGSPPADRDLAMELTVDDWSRFCAHFPNLRAEQRPLPMSGAAAARVEARRQAGNEHWRGSVDLKSSRLQFSEDQRWIKPAGMPWRVAFEATRAHLPDGDVELSVPEFECRWGSTAFKVGNLQATFSGWNWDDSLIALLGPSERPQRPALKRLHLDARADIALDSPSAVPELPGGLRLEGPWNADLHLAHEDGTWLFRGRADGKVAWTGVPTTVEPARFRWHTQWSRDGTRGARRVELSDTALDLADFTAQATGRASWNADDLYLEAPRHAEINARLDLTDCSRIARVWPDWKTARPTGRVHAEGHWIRAEHPWELRRAALTFEEFRLHADELQAGLEGALVMDGGRWSSDALQVHLGDHRAVLGGSGRLWNQHEPLSAWIRLPALHGPRLAQDLDRWVGGLPPSLKPLPAGVLRPAEWRRLADTLDVDFSLAVDQWTVRDARLGTHLLDEVISHGSWRRGLLDWQIRAGLEGGLLEAELQGGVTEPTVRYDLSGCLPSPHVRQLLRRVFPGVLPSGTIDYSRRPSAADSEPHESGEAVVASGELIIRGGTLRGKAAPDWVTTVFPRLNLASFSFDDMHDWYAELSDGRVRHRAIFRGQYYHLYADGMEEPEGRAVFEIGIDLLAGLDSEYWTHAGSGRIPLFVTSSRIGEDGQLLEESVRYEPLELVKAILWGTNPIHTAYLALRKRISEDDAGREPTGGDE